LCTLHQKTNKTAKIRYIKSSLRSSTKSSLFQILFKGLLPERLFDDVTKVIHKLNDEIGKLGTIFRYTLGFSALGILYWSLEPIVSNFAFVRQWRLNWVLEKNLQESSSYPVYVEHKKTINNIMNEVMTGMGVLVLWGPPDSGKTSYAIKALNQLSKEGKIRGVLKIMDEKFKDGIDGEGIDWFNKVVGLKKPIFHSAEKISKIISKSWVDWICSMVGRVTKGSQVVLFFDQFDNCIDSLSNIEPLLRFLKKTAEDACKHANYCVVVCVTDPHLAEKICNLNGKRKVRLIQMPEEL
jgi:hypothetical protein